METPPHMRLSKHKEANQRLRKFARWHDADKRLLL